MASTPAQIAKEKGNAAFKAADYPTAIGHYTDAILADPKDFTFPLNRAAAYLKLGKAEDAERDCTTVLTLSPKNVKALFRRGQARSASGKYAEAQEDFETAVKLDPLNAAAAEEFKKAKIALQQAQIKPRKTPVTVEPPPLVGSLSSPSSTSVPPKRRRIPIAIVEAPTSPSHHPMTDASASSLSMPADLLTPVSSRPLSASPATSTEQPMVSVKPSSGILTATTPAPPPGPTKSMTSFQEAKQARDTTKPSRVGGGIFRASGQHTIFPERQSTPATLQSAPVPAAQTTGGAANLLPAHAISKDTKPPMTSFMFLKSWELLKDPLKRWKLLTQIPPASISALFQDSLEAHVLASILRTLDAVLDGLSGLPDSADEVRQWVHSYMVNLAKVPRFGTLVLFMSASEKATARTICSTLADVGMPAAGWENV